MAASEGGRKWRPVLRIGILVGSLGLGFGAVLPAAMAYSWDGSDAAAYGHKWASNSEKLRNDDDKSFGNDCTNFVSQALLAGGLPKDASGAYVWTYNDHWYGDSYTDSWVNAVDLVTYLTESGHGAIESLSHSMAAKYTSALKGDVFVYEWGDDDGHADHVSLASGWGQFADYDDADQDKNYRSVTGGSGDYISQHTHDRDYSPWNWGYWTESNVAKRSKMLTWVVHVH